MDAREWKDIEGYEGHYLVKDAGEMASLKHGGHRILRPTLNYNGYLVVNLYKDGKRVTHYVHRLVAMAYCKGEEEGLTVNHIDENKLNNHASNLEWIPQGDNARHSISLNWIVMLPEGEELEVLNLRRFCRDRGLDSSSMVKVSKGKLSHYKQYKVRRGI